VGQKINPISLRLGINEDWRSRWYANKQDFGTLLVADQRIREHIRKNYAFAGIPKIEIQRTSAEARVSLHCARPGVIIGRKGQQVEQLRGELEALAGCTVYIDIKEIDQPEANAALIGQGISEQLKKRASFRRVMRRAAETAIQAGCQGVRIELSGRLGGSDMCRRERTVIGMVPLHTLDAVIDYALTKCVTTYGAIGIKVWVYKGESDSIDRTEAPDRKRGGRPGARGGERGGRGRSDRRPQRRDARSASQPRPEAAPSADAPPEAPAPAPAAQPAPAPHAGNSAPESQASGGDA
jgi:small subunit ribosomal protein S3